MKIFTSLICCVVSITPVSLAFTPASKRWESYASISSAKNVASSTSSTSGKGFAPANNNGHVKTTEELKEEAMALTPAELKANLLDLIPKMMGKPEEFRLVESYVNALEDKFVPPQTLGFLNMAMIGDWQFLFTTNQIGRPSPNLRLTELLQRIECSNFDGKLTTEVSAKFGIR